MSFGRTGEGLRVVGESEVLVMFVTADGEDTARNVFRRAQNYITCEGGKKNTKDRIKISDIHNYKTIFNRTL
jgi:hypothetical protein